MHCLFYTTKNKIDYHRGKDCMKRFCKDLEEHAIKIINYEIKEMTSLTNKENKLYRNQKVCHICKKQFSTDVKKIRDHCHFTGKYRGAAHDICNLNYKAPNEIPVIFHNGSTYDCHFIIIIIICRRS